MPLRLEIQRQLSSRSDRVKCVDIHPTEPWVLASLYNGHVFLWNYSTQALVKSFEVTELPVRTAKFIPRKQWIICGSDDNNLRVYNYNTLEKVKVWEAHTDYIRCIAVHPTQTYVLSSSDDMFIKLWDWENWNQNPVQPKMVFDPTAPGGHNHYVMMVTFNPKDANTFASASLDRTIKVWGITTPQPHFTLEGHEKGVNCVDYFTSTDRPYLVSGADDKTVRVWDYQGRTEVQRLEGHIHNVSTVCCHPELPIILSGSEDGTVRVWHATTYRPENTLNYGFERCWSLCALKGTNSVAIGYDEGTVMIKLGREEPIASMDSQGKIVWAKHNEIQQVNVKTLPADEEYGDGERLPLTVKELDVCEIYPQSLKHSSNGRFGAVCGDGEFIIYTAVAWRKKHYGNALELVWATDAGDYATRETSSCVKIFKNFKESKVFKPPFSADALYGGPFIALRSSDVVFFYDWQECRCIRRIDVNPIDIFWSENGELVVISCEECFYLLRYNKEVAMAHLDSGAEIEEDGIEDSFELLHEVPERVKTGCWVGDCFIYTNTLSRLNYTVGGEVITLHHLDRPLYLVGYLPKENKVYLIDKDYNVVSYQLLLSMMEYQTAVVRKDFETAANVLPSIPVEHHNRIARFLEAQGFMEEALQVATDPEHKFELAVQLGKLELAYQICEESESETKWKQLGDLAILNAQFDLGKTCLQKANDFPGILMLAITCGDVQMMDHLAVMATKQGRNNIAFIALFLRGETQKCLDLLVATGRAAEAAFLARTYKPSQVPATVQMWKAELSKVHEKAAESIADPTDYPNLFPDLQWALKAEEYLSRTNAVSPSTDFLSQKDDTLEDLIQKMKDIDSGDVPPLEEKDEFVEAKESMDAPEEPTVVEPAVTSEPQAPKPSSDTEDLEAELDKELEGELDGIEGVDGEDDDEFLK